jgi:hypothetical protein
MADAPRANLAPSREGANSPMPLDATDSLHFAPWREILEKNPGETLDI